MRIMQSEPGIKELLQFFARPEAIPLVTKIEIETRFQLSDLCLGLGYPYYRLPLIRADSNYHYALSILALEVMAEAPKDMVADGLSRLLVHFGLG